MLKAYNLLYGIEEKDSYFLFNDKKLTLNDETTIMSKFRSILVILNCHRFSKLFANENIYGKKIKGKVLIDGKNVEINIGTLNSTKILFIQLEKYNKYIKKIYIGKNIINKDDDINLYSLGIKNDFNFK